MATLHDLFDLSGRVAVITGASSGLGTTRATALAEAGVRIIAAGARRSPSRRM